MSISTRTGDNGTTALLFGERARKSDPIFRVIGLVDTLSAQLGNAICILKQSNKSLLNEKLQTLLQLQHDLTQFMGMLACPIGKEQTYITSKYAVLSEEWLSTLDSIVNFLELRLPKQTDWEHANNNALEVAFNLTRTTCREFERELWMLKDTHALTDLVSPVHFQIINRLSDVLWLCTRAARLSFA